MSTVTERVKGTGQQAPLVVVAGFGAAGAAAAVAAAESGARVLVCDRAPAVDRGGNTRENLFYMSMKSVDEVDPDLMAALRASTAPTETTAAEWGVDREFLSVWIEDAAPTLKWLQQLGFEFSYSESDIIDDGFAPGLIPHGGGNVMLDVLEDKAKQLGVQFAYETALVGIRTDEDGTVTQVVLESAGARRSASAQAVILATGGFHGNYELMTQYLGPRARYAVPLTRYAYYNKGEGLRVALGLGAATTGDLGEWHGLTIDARAKGERWVVGGGPLGIMVNTEGRRFVDEALWEPAEKAVRDQPGGTAFYLLDAEGSRHPFYGRRFSSGGAPLRANTIEELAELIDVSPEELARTVAEYNAACDAAGGGAGASLDIPKTDGAVSLTEAPFEAWPVQAGICFSLGGLRVDAHGRVLSLDGRPIPGLYAAGDVAGGYFGEYVNYTSSLKALVLGRRSGCHASTSESDGSA
ncbi:FAD-dependent oxidoreductase [Streptomyces sp. NPDC047061]|uniref:FAD-dependent oxidoreductase n=1 Tax=Streptomyces sp. NPDC047061 TaxID=3154605 RepID=UPI003411EF28